MPLMKVFYKAAFFLLWGFITQALNAEPIKIGVTLPLSGAFAASGESVRNSILLAQHTFDPEKKVQFLFEDDQLNPKNTIPALQKFIAVDHIKGAIIWGTPTALAGGEIIERERIPTVAFSMLGRVVKGKSYIVKHWLSAETITTQLGPELQKRNIKTIALVTMVNDAMLELKKLFEESNLAKIVLNDEYQKGETDFKSTVTKIQHIKPDAVYVLLWSSQLSLFTKALRETGYSGQIFGTQNMEDKNEVHNAGGALNNAWFVGLDDSAAAEFYGRYRATYHSEPVAGAVNAYDVGAMFITCSKAQDINNCIHQVKDFDGILGKYSITERHDFSLAAKVKCIKNQEIVDEGC